LILRVHLRLHIHSTFIEVKLYICILNKQVIIEETAKEGTSLDVLPLEELGRPLGDGGVEALAEAIVGMYQSHLLIGISTRENMIK